MCSAAAMPSVVRCFCRCDEDEAEEEVRRPFFLSYLSDKLLGDFTCFLSFLRLALEFFFFFLFLSSINSGSDSLSLSLDLHKRLKESI